MFSSWTISGNPWERLILSFSWDSLHGVALFYHYDYSLVLDDFFTQYLSSSLQKSSRQLNVT